MANMRQQSKGREKERDILGDTPPQFWLLSRRVVDIPPCGSFPDPFLANSPPPLVDFLPHFVVDDTPDVRC